MQSIHLFDEITLAEVSERLKRIEAFQKQIEEDKQTVNTIALTVARMRGAKPTDLVSLNEERTGVVISEVEESASEAVESEAVEAPAEGRKGRR